MVDKSLIKETVQLFIALGLGLNETYVIDFENPFLETTRAYYRETSDKWMLGGSLSCYLNHVKDAIDAEKSRSKYYLHHDTEELLLTVIDEECLGSKLPFLFIDLENNNNNNQNNSPGSSVMSEECRGFFQRDAREELYLMYTLLAR